ncbi:MAG: FixH family protein [Telluria sp.]
MNNHSHIVGTAPQPPWYAQRWPWLLMLGPTSVVVAGAFTTWLAVSRPDALVVGDYYKQGKAINQDLRRDRMASGMHLAVKVHFDAQAGRLEGTLTSFDRPLAASLKVTLAHPTQPEKDIALLARTDGAGRFSVLLPALEHTHWQVVVEGEQKDWRLARSWDYSKQGQLEIWADPL